MLNIALIRHGKTKANLEKRYLGRTDEGLCLEGKAEICSLLSLGLYPPVEAVYASPMARCLETAEIIYPKLCPTKIDVLQECDFGSFEYLTYQDLKYLPSYQNWLDTEGEGEIPGGEASADFRKRCVLGFDQVVKSMVENGLKTGAIVAHGGTIMAILAAYARPNQDFYSWQAANGHGYLVVVEDWQAKQELSIFGKI